MTALLLAKEDFTLKKCILITTQLSVISLSLHYLPLLLIILQDINSGDSILQALVDFSSQHSSRLPVE